MSDPWGSSEDQNVGRNVDSKSCAHEISEDSTEDYTRGDLCYILAKNLSTFCLCPDTLWEVYFKSDRLFFHSKLQNSPAMAWLFLAASSQVYSAKTRVERLEKLAVWFKKPV
jgi:hypothetical protein